MKWIVECSDEAAGMVRYFDIEVNADTKDDALKKVAKRFKNSGPGIGPIGARPKPPKQKKR